MYLRIIKPLSLQYLLAVDGSFGIDLLPRIRRDWSDISNPIHVHTEPNFQPIACRIHRYFVDKTQAKILLALIFYRMRKFRQTADIEDILTQQ